MCIMINAAYEVYGMCARTARTPIHVFTYYFNFLDLLYNKLD